MREPFWTGHEEYEACVRNACVMVNVMLTLNVKDRQLFMHPHATVLFTQPILICISVLWVENAAQHDLVTGNK